MKIESRGKYPGVKLHLDPEECEVLLQLVEAGKVDNFAALKGAGKTIQVPFNLTYRMGQHVRDLLAAEPGLLKERTPEQIVAILAKESEKAGIQLNRLKNGQDWKKIDPVVLQKALLHHVKA